MLNEPQAESVEALFEAAQGAYRLHRFEDAEAKCRQALDFDVAHAGSKVLLAILAGMKGQAELGIQLFREVVAADPASYDGINGLAVLLRSTGSATEAATLCRQAIELKPAEPAPYYNLGRCFLDQKNPGEAVAWFEKAIYLNPKMPIAHHDLGAALQLMGRGTEAAAEFRKAIALAPSSATSYVELGHLLLSNGNPEGAISCFRKAYEIQPNSARGQLHLGRALVEEANFEEAEKVLLGAISLDPNLAEAYTLLGRALQQCGRFEEARAHLEKSIELDPERTNTYYNIVNGRKITEEDRPLVERMVALVGDERLPLEQLRPLHYSIGKALEDLGDYKGAIRHFDEANRMSEMRLLNAGRMFNPDRLRLYVADTIATFTTEYLARFTNLGDPSDKPVFIVGMARSGTTLLEQIVSSHPVVGAAGELGFWMTVQPQKFKNAADSQDRGQIAQVASAYLGLLNRAGPESHRVTDKLPQNYMALGPIRITFPNSRIIHCRRNPVDTCLSIYTTSFKSGPDFAHNRKQMVFAYKQYLRLMEHWREVLPAENFLEVDYEELVSNPEPVSRMVIEFLGLDWDDACLHHEKNLHAISTPSLWQARQPIFKTSMDRWRRYEQWLGPFRELLEDEKPPSQEVAAMDAIALNNLGLSHFAERRYAEAAENFQRAIKVMPRLASIRQNLGLALHHLGRNDEAASSFRAAIELDPKSVQPYRSLAQLMLQLGRSDEAIPLLRRAYNLEPESARGLLQLAQALSEENRVEEAESCLRKAISFEPGNGPAHELLGALLKQTGRFEEAMASLKRAIEAQPLRKGLFMEYVNCRKMTTDDRPLIEDLRMILQGGSLGPDDRSQLHFALGKVFDDLSEYEQAIHHFDEAHRLAEEELKKRGQEFDEGECVSRFDAIIDTFSKHRLGDKVGGSESNRPVFIVGMVRSGTTLVEQILSCHPQVGAGGELTFWSQNWQSLPPTRDGFEPQAQDMLAQQYLRLLQSIDPKAQHVTDKMPGNFIALGAIHAVFPRAKIIACCREPIDNCLSIYTTAFRTGHNWIHNRNNIVCFYRQHERLMAHWRDVIPRESLLVIDYEELVKNQDRVTRQIVQFCGPEWDDACLKPEGNHRVVKTPSQWQVRQPVYRSSVERWRKYEPWLGPFKKLLESEPQRREPNP